MKCANCNSKNVEIKKVDFKIYGISLGKFEAEVCNRCRKEVFSEEVSGEIDKIAKEKGLWALETHTKIGRSGDGLVIRVNKKLAEFMGLKEGEEITLIPESKEKLIVQI
ncbi:MAG TPA: hypothetical protein VJJ23_01570 [Candidatus Nanoarchaeia archaeon]|nr:hypothetical protein [Candidatus Nanoarchaeia archaeon]